jgi:cold shock CspA family protein
MKYFGTVKSYDEISGHGFIEPAIGGEPLGFAQGTGSWTQVAPPRPGQRLSYDVHHTNGLPNAVNVEAI